MMKKTAVFIFWFLLAAALSAAAQTNARTVTNLDLEKYRQERIQADSDYRENYQKRGMPSPEEIDKRLETSRTKLEELSVKLRAERLERDRIEAANRYYEAMQAQYSTPQIQVSNPGYEGLGFYWANGPRGRYRVYYRPRPQFQQPGYFAGGHFWPTPSYNLAKPPRSGVAWLKPKN